jgi:acetyl esterase/lipase
MKNKIKKNITILLYVYFTVFSATTTAQNNKLNIKYAEITNAELPSVLLIGNSVCKGYSKYVIDSLAGIANVDVWTTGANVASSTIQKQLISVIRKVPYNVIHFNIGLHGLGNRIQQENYAALMNKYVNTVSNYSRDSKLIWASITPVRIKGTATLDTTAGRNNLIILRNKITGRIMSKRGIPTNDLYSLAVKNIELGTADGVHWTDTGYKLFAAQITKVIKQTLKTVTVTKQVQPTLKNVRYGPYKRNVLNFWQAKSDKPTPVVIKIHGGGWAAGSKSETISSDYFLQDGISVISINYRLIKTDILPAPVYDAARALQFVRSKAKEWNINKERIAVTGGSAGGCTSLWLIYHDDLADPENSDPVLRESTKPFCAAVESAQSCLDPFIAKKWIGNKIIEDGMFWKAVGAKSPKDLIENYDKYKTISHDFSPYFHIDKDDPPVFMINHNPLTFPAPNGGLAIHHPMFVFKVKEKADKVGCEAQLILRGTRQQNYYDSMDFIKSKLLNR